MQRRFLGEPFRFPVPVKGCGTHQNSGLTLSGVWVNSNTPQKISIASTLPSELLEEIFLHVMLQCSKFKTSWNSLIVVNRAWSEVALRLEVVRIEVQSELQAIEVIEQIKQIQASGVQRAPTRFLDIDSPGGLSPHRLSTLLHLVGTYVEHLEIRGDEATPVLVPSTGVLYLTRVRHMYCNRIQDSDLGTLLLSTSCTLESLGLLYSTIRPSAELKEQLHLPALRDLFLQGHIQSEGLTMLKFLCSAAPRLHCLEMSIGRSDLASTISWLQDDGPKALKRLVLSIRVADRYRLDKDDDQIKALWQLLNKRTISRKISAHAGGGEWAIELPML